MLLRIDGPCAVCAKEFCLLGCSIEASDGYLLERIRAIRRGADAICPVCQERMQMERLRAEAQGGMLWEPKL